MKHILPLLVATLLLTGCSKSVVDETRIFTTNTWNRFTPEVFSPVVSNTEDYYNIDITVCVDTTIYRYSDVPLTVNLYSPNGERRMFYANVPLKLNSRWRGEIEEDGYRQVTHHIRTFFSFNCKGEHRMEVGQATSQYDLEGIHSLNLNIYKVNLDYGDL